MPSLNIELSLALSCVPRLPAIIDPNPCGGEIVDGRKASIAYRTNIGRQGSLPALLSDPDQIGNSPFIDEELSDVLRIIAIALTIIGAKDNPMASDGEKPHHKKEE
jgi:hypothetical protein